MQNALEDELPSSVRDIGDLLPGEGAGALSPRKRDELGKRNVVASIAAQIGKARNAVLAKRQSPAGRQRALHENAQIDLEGARKTDGGLARPRRAHRHVKRHHQRMATGGLCAAHQIETDGVVVAGEAIELEPEYVGRDLGDLFDGCASDAAQHVRDACALRGAREMEIGAGPNDRRPAHGRNAGWRGIAAAEQFDVAVVGNAGMTPYRGTNSTASSAAQFRLMPASL